SNALKRLGFRSHNFLAQLLPETSTACTIRVRRSTLGRLWNDLGSHAGGDRPPAGTESLGRIGGGRETGYPAGLVPKAHRHQVRRIEVSQIPGSSRSGRGKRAVSGADGEGKSRVGL